MTNPEVLILLLIPVVLCLVLLIRNHQVYKFRIQLIKEESEFCQRRTKEGKGFTGYLRLDSLPSYEKMVLQFWKPLSTYIKKPLVDYYK